MTDLKIMESKEPSYEVAPRSDTKTVPDGITCETFDSGPEWVIRLKDDDEDMFLTAAAAMAVAEFISSHVRKRW